ncbi:MAG TPA: hypothetical protein VK633_11790 [Verrucomicrobiae bacterium]|nr:hypothetical protein [Verrucomicrobiae bacterium]
MKGILSLLGSAVLLAGCGKNEPGTMGGEAATPRTVATGAPAETAKDSNVSNARRSAIQSEHAASTFDDSAGTNQQDATLPQASSLATNRPAR